MDKEASIRDLGAAMEKLAETSPRSKAELKVWDLEAKRIIDELIIARGLETETPHFLWTYLSEASVRFRDPQYAERMQPVLEALLTYLKEGVLPEDSDLP